MMRNFMWNFLTIVVWVIWSILGLLLVAFFVLLNLGPDDGFVAIFWSPTLFTIFAFLFSSVQMLRARPSGRGGLNGGIGTTGSAAAASSGAAAGASVAAAGASGASGSSYCGSSGGGGC